MRMNFAVAALASAALMATSAPASATIFGENDFQVTTGQVKIISRWRATFSTDQYTDSYVYGFIGAKIDSNGWSSAALVSSAYVAQIVNAYCYSGDYSYTGYSGAGAGLEEVDSEWSYIYLFSCY